MYINRNLEKIIKPFLKRREALSIIGPRQAGKTTFIKYLEKQFKNKSKKVKFITFEKITDLELFKNSIEDFKDLIKSYQYVIIDEFQYAKDGGQKLKYLYDTTKIKFIVSGSSSLDLTFQTGKYMVGRMLDFKLLPFSFREYLSYKDQELYNLLEQRIKTDNILNFNIKNGFGQEINKRLSRMLEKYVVYGGYPAVVLSKTNKEKEKVLQGIIERYLLRDIKGLLGLTTEDEIIRLSNFLALQIGNIIKYEELSNAANLSYREVLKYLNILEKTFIVKLIRPYFTNKRIELTKNPKNYFVDLGMRNSLISDYRNVESRNDLGGIMENYAYNLLHVLDLSEDIKYWRTKSKAEVDFVIRKEQSICPVEIKYVSRKIIGKSFYSFINKFKPVNGLILTKDYLGEEKIRRCKIKFVPLSYF